jgi:hypothetical protein
MIKLKKIKEILDNEIKNNINNSDNKKLLQKINHLIDQEVLDRSNTINNFDINFFNPLTIQYKCEKLRGYKISFLLVENKSCGLYYLHSPSLPLLNDKNEIELQNTDRQYTKIFIKLEYEYRWPLNYLFDSISNIFELIYNSVEINWECNLTSWILKNKLKGCRIKLSPFIKMSNGKLIGITSTFIHI